MCDRISQLQDQINLLAEHMCNALGILQQTAAPSALPGSDILLSTTVKHESSGDIPPSDYPALFATLIEGAAQACDRLIDQLPADDLNQDQLISAIRKSDTNSKEAVESLLDTVQKGQRLMARMQDALVDIAACETEIRKLDL